MGKKRIVSFYVDHKKFDFVTEDNTLVVPVENKILMPHGLSNLLKNYRPEDYPELYHYPYLNSLDFKLFMNLILTPLDLPLNNPDNKTIKNIWSVVKTFTSSPIDDDVIKLFKVRLS